MTEPITQPDIVDIDGELVAVDTEGDDEDGYLILIEHQCRNHLAVVHLEPDQAISLAHSLLDIATPLLDTEETSL
jgi:hypothetical protein